MTTWKIDPAGVAGILNNVASEQEALANVLTDGEFQAIFTGISGAGALVAEGPKALQALMQNQKANLQAVTNRIAAGISGVSNAVAAYNNGQQEMAGEFQRQMATSAASGDFSYFQQHGYKGEGM